MRTMPADSDQLDFFVSYARADNATGWITQFIEALQAEHRTFSGGREFKAFFDKKDIHSLDAWQERIYESLAASRLFLAFISPNYFASEWCRREWRTWIDVEISKHVLSSGAAPIYIVEVPWLGQTMNEQEVAESIALLTKRVLTDLTPGLAADAQKVTAEMSQRQLTQGERSETNRANPTPFFANVQDFQTTGLDVLRRAHLKKVLTELAKDLDDRAQHVADAAKSRSTIPPYNRRFVGRLKELTLLRERLHQGRTGVISGHKGDLPEDKSVIASVHGLGGIGKTELAFTYAHAFAGLYPGGRFLVPCDGRSDLRQAMLALDEIFRAEISDEQRKTLDLHFGAIRDCLRRRLHEMGRILLVLDNVTDAALLSPEQTDSVRALGPELHLLATTRLGAPEGGGTFDDVHWLTLGELSFEDSLRLLEKHRAFSTPEERAAAESIARRLGGFALCVEVVGAYLGQHPEQSYAQFLATMGLDDLAPVDLAAERRDVVTRRHNNEKRLRIILDHTLRELAPEAMSALHFASLLPPDHIVLPWLSKLVGDVHPALATDAIAWQRLIAHLVSLALLTRGEDGEAQALDESHQPRVLRCHRLLQDYLRGKSGDVEKTARQEAVDALAEARAIALENVTRWEESRWELEPFAALAGLWDETNHPRAAWLLNHAGLRWLHLAEWSQSEPLMRRAVAIDEHRLGPEHPDVARDLNDLGRLLLYTCRLTEAEPLMRRALAIDEQESHPEHPDVARDLTSLAALLKATNRLAEAEPLMQRALAIDEQSYGLVHPDIARDLNNLAALLKATNRLAEAEPLMRRALAVSQESCGPVHPDVARDLGDLAGVLLSTNRLAEAEPLMRRALAIDEQSFGPVHPNVAVRLNNLAFLLNTTNRLTEAEPLMRRALAIDEQSFGPVHPNVARQLNNLAELLRATNRLAEAEPLMRRALAIEEQSFGPVHPDVAAPLNNLAALLQDTNRLAEAEPLMRRALAIDEQSFGPVHPIVAIRLNNLALLMKETNRLAEAEPLMRRVVVVLAKVTAATSHEQPQLRSAIANYQALLFQSGLTEKQTEQRLLSALREGDLDKSRIIKLLGTDPKLLEFLEFIARWLPLILWVILMACFAWFAWHYLHYPAKR